MLKAHHGTAFNPMTYSIAALDPETGEIGVAVASYWPAVGAMVPWLEPGVGAVVTQAFTNVDLGPTSLALLRDGVPAEQVLRRVLADDPHEDERQVGLVDAAGSSAAHTGARCVAAAGHRCSSGVSVQANMAERADAPQAMLDTFGAASGDLADRLLTTLRAGERHGGDVRGRLSAVLLVAPGAGGTQPWTRRFDLRVDASPEPIEKLARLLRLARAYEALDAAIDASGVGEFDAALAGTAAAFALAPDDAQVAFWHAAVLFAKGRAHEARPLLEAALAAEPRLEEFGRRWADAGHGSLLAAALREMRRPPT